MKINDLPDYFIIAHGSVVLKEEPNKPLYVETDRHQFITYTKLGECITSNFNLDIISTHKKHEHLTLNERLRKIEQKHKTDKHELLDDPCTIKVTPRKKKFLNLLFTQPQSHADLLEEYVAFQLLGNQLITYKKSKQNSLTSSDNTIPLSSIIPYVPPGNIHILTCQSLDPEEEETTIDSHDTRMAIAMDHLLTLYIDLTKIYEGSLPKNTLNQLIKQISYRLNKMKSYQIFSSHSLKQYTLHRHQDPYRSHKYISQNTFSIIYTLKCLPIQTQAQKSHIRKMLTFLYMILEAFGPIKRSQDTNITYRYNMNIPQENIDFIYKDSIITSQKSTRNTPKHS